MPWRLYKRGKIYYGAFYDGDKVRVRRSTQCRDQQAAEAKVKEWEREAADPDSAAARSATLEEALTLLIKHRDAEAKAGKMSSATVEFYRKKAGHWLRYLECEGNPPRRTKTFYLKNLRPRIIDGYIALRRDEGVSEHTIHKELTTLRAALRLAKRYDLWKGDIEELFPPGFSPEYQPRTRVLTPEELNVDLDLTNTCQPTRREPPVLKAIACHTKKKW